MPISVSAEEGIKFLQKFEQLYDKAAPIIRRIADPKILQHGELPVSPRTLVECNITLQFILGAVKKLPNPRDRELSILQRDFEIALSSCIKAAVASEKYMEIGDHKHDGILMQQIINATVLASEYIKVVKQKLGALVPRAESTQLTQMKINHTIKPVVVTEPRTIKFIPREKVTEKTAPQESAVDKAANIIETGLDKLGDALMAPIDKITRFSAAKFRKNNLK